MKGLFSGIMKAAVYGLAGAVVDQVTGLSSKVPAIMPAATGKVTKGLTVGWYAAILIVQGGVAVNLAKRVPGVGKMVSKLA